MSEPKKTKDGRWKVDFWPAGRNGPRIRKTFDLKSEANRFITFEKNKYLQETKPWQPSVDRTRLNELIDTWYESHGKTLKDGFRRRTALYAISKAIGNPVAQKLDPRAILKYRSVRLEQGISEKTANNEMTYLNAVYNELIRNKVIHYQNPIDGIRPLKIDETELSYLKTEQIKELLAAIEHPDAHLIAKICLSTGCRWGEAQSLRRRQIRDGHIHFTQTKSSRNRNVPINQTLESELMNLNRETLFGWSLSAFRRALKKTSIELPKGQASHVLRHTFASHFMMNGGNILTLQRILGHSSITMTMRYAHLAPEHLQEAVRLNPLSKLK